jgi:carbonic anhydrase
MNRTVLVISSAVAGLWLATAACAGEHAHWTYSGAEGPEHWGGLDAAYSACASGRNQSPVDLTGMVEGELPALRLSYQPGGQEVVNNGHTVQINYAPGSTLEVDGHSFELKQFHFHAPSENVIEGKPFPMEAHFVHADAAGNLAVISVMFKVGAGNAELAKAWAQMPEAAGGKHALAAPVSATALLPAGHDYYRFNGSLTTPPCSEGVVWLVMKDTATASQAQVEKFMHAMHHPNNRPVQPLNARVVVK